MSTEESLSGRRGESDTEALGVEGSHPLRHETLFIESRAGKGTPSKEKNQLGRGLMARNPNLNESARNRLVLSGFYRSCVPKEKELARGASGRRLLLLKEKSRGRGARDK